MKKIYLIFTVFIIVSMPACMTTLCETELFGNRDEILDVVHKHNIPGRDFVFYGGIAGDIVIAFSSSYDSNDSSYENNSRGVLLSLGIIIADFVFFDIIDNLLHPHKSNETKPKDNALEYLKTITPSKVNILRP